MLSPRHCTNILRATTREQLETIGGSEILADNILQALQYAFGSDFIIRVYFRKPDCGIIMRDDKTISASEINRYIYCNYQWYYERKHGATELRQLRRGAHSASAPTKNSPIQRGLVFHANYGRRFWLARLYVWLRAAVLLAAFLYFLLCGGMVVQ